MENTPQERSAKVRAGLKKLSEAVPDQLDDNFLAKIGEKGFQITFTVAALGAAIMGGLFLFAR